MWHSSWLHFLNDDLTVSALQYKVYHLFKWSLTRVFIFLHSTHGDILDMSVLRTWVSLSNLSATQAYQHTIDQGRIRRLPGSPTTWPLQFSLPITPMIYSSDGGVIFSLPSRLKQAAMVQVQVQVQVHVSSCLVGNAFANQWCQQGRYWCMMAYQFWKSSVYDWNAKDDATKLR
jgi:hypothetical protein